MAPGACVGQYRPACCAAVENFVANRHRDAHKQKLTRARSLINNGWSVREDQKLVASRRNVKNEQIQDDRFNNIERENMRLLIRMQEINQKREGERRKSEKVSGEACAAAGRAILGAPQPVGPTKCISRCSSLPAKGKGSNNDARMRELRRIDTDNQRMLKRLQGAKPSFSNKQCQEHHEAQQRVMRMRRENGPRLPPSKVPLPFAAQSFPIADPETERIENLHAEMQRKLQELERMDGTAPLSEAGASPAATPPSARSEAGASAEPGDDCEDDVRPLHVEQREYVGGQMPEHSRLLVEKLMEELEELENPAAREHPDTSLPEDEEVPDDKDAVSRMLAAADALEAPDYSMHAPDYLSYENVVQRSRMALEAAAASQRVR